MGLPPGSAVKARFALRPAVQLEFLCAPGLGATCRLVALQHCVEAVPWLLAHRCCLVENQLSRGMWAYF